MSWATEQDASGRNFTYHRKTGATNMREHRRLKRERAEAIQQGRNTDASEHLPESRLRSRSAQG